MFGENELAETPAIDPKSIIGRTIEANLSELLGQRDKYYMNLKFKIDKIDDSKAYTKFSGYSCAKEHLFRIIRKRSQKVRATSDVETKDGWKLHLVSLLVLNRNANIEIQKKARAILVNELEKSANDSSIDTFIRLITSGVLQKEIRKKGNKIYPVRFSEIERIEVLRDGPLGKSVKVGVSVADGPLGKSVKVDVPDGDGSLGKSNNVDVSGTDGSTGKVAKTEAKERGANLEGVQSAKTDSSEGAKK